MRRSKSTARLRLCIDAWAEFRLAFHEKGFAPFATREEVAWQLSADVHFLARPDLRVWFCSLDVVETREALPALPPHRKAR